MRSGSFLAWCLLVAQTLMEKTQLLIVGTIFKGTGRVNFKYLHMIDECDSVVCSKVLECSVSYWENY